MVTISRAGFGALMEFQYAHEDRLGGIDLSGSRVTVAVVAGPTEPETSQEIRAIIDAHPGPGESVGDGGGDGDHAVDIILVEHSHAALYEIMYVIPTAVEQDPANTRMRCSVDILHNRVTAWFDPLTVEITQRAADLWGPTVDVGPLPPDAPRLVARPRRPHRA